MLNVLCLYIERRVSKRIIKFGFSSVHTNLKAQIRRLRPIMATTAVGNRLRVTATFILSLIDGKVFSALTATLYIQCPICCAGTDDLNDVENLDTNIFEPTDEGLIHGVQPMHAWMKFLIHLINISCNLPIRQAIKDGVPYDAQEIRRTEKLRIQKAFKKFGLRIDKPEQFGFGNSLDGNTSRRIFRNYDEVASILRIERSYVKRYYIILCVINNTSYMPKIQEFKEYCHKTFRMFRKKYRYTMMSPSVHKVCANRLSCNSVQ